MPRRMLLAFGLGLVPQKERRVVALLQLPGGFDNGLLSLDRGPRAGATVGQSHTTRTRGIGQESSATDSLTKRNHDPSKVTGQFRRAAIKIVRSHSLGFHLTVLATFNFALIRRTMQIRGPSWKLGGWPKRLQLKAQEGFIFGCPMGTKRQGILRLNRVC